MILVVNDYTENIHLGDLQMKEIGRLAQELSGQDFLVKRYYEVSARFLEDHPEITGVILSGCNCKWDNMYFDIFEGVFDLVRNAKIPVLGICAGHQLIAMAYGAAVRRCDFGKEERFFTEMEMLKESPLTEGIEGNVYAFEFHNCAVMEVPEGCERLMTSKKTYIQAFKRIGEHKYGVQFHPELDKEASDPMFRADASKELSGTKILSNFLAICK